MNHSQIEEYLTEVEKAAQQKFRYRAQVSWLLTVVYARKLELVFEDVLFFSKFLSNAYSVLKREGVGSDTIGNLKQEFSVNLEKIHTLLRTIVKESEEPGRGEFIARFLSMTPECMEHLMALAKELTWIKNYNLDQKR